jgi:hypothetical protein
MAEFLSCNRLAELWMMIEQLHLSYLQTDENLHKIEQRKKLEGSLVYLISFIYQYNK